MSLALAGLDTTAYFLPGDGPEAERDFLVLLHDPGETWGADYGFALPELVAAIEAADAAGVAQHWILDRSQFGGHVEHPIVLAMLPLLRHTDVTISTAGPDSRSPSQLMHSKVMVTLGTDGGEPWCWVGSVNFSKSGWLESNLAFRFRSRRFADAFVAWFDRTRDWARLHIPQPAAPVAAQAVAVLAVAVPITEGVPA